MMMMTMMTIKVLMSNDAVTVWLILEISRMLVLAVTNAQVCCPLFMAYCISAWNTLFSWFTISCNQKCTQLWCLKCTKFVFRPTGPHWGSSRRSPKPPSWLGRGIPPPHSPPPRRLRRLVLGACSASPRVGDLL